MIYCYCNREDEKIEKIYDADCFINFKQKYRKFNDKHSLDLLECVL